MSVPSAPGNPSLADADTGIRVVVTPTQSAYFAGETFSVSITITNTRPVHAPWPSSGSQSHTHKRASHSISSAPLARPPTSPGTPRTAVTPIPALKHDTKDSTPKRRRLIGKAPANGTDAGPDFLDQSRKRLLAKSLSVSLSPKELEERFGRSNGGAPLAAQSSHYSSPSNQPPGALARTPTLSIAPNHPHARKKSVLNGQLHLNEPQQPPSSPTLASPDPSSSKLSLSLDTISESSSTSAPQTPSLQSPNPGLASLPNQIRKSGLFVNGNHRHHRPPPLPHPDARSYDHASQAPKTSQHGLGNGVPSQSHLAVPRTAFSSSFPQSNNELVLYSYAQLSGSLTITPVPGLSPSTPDTARTLSALRSTLLCQGAMGGGSMDITSSIDPQQAKQHARKRPHVRSASYTSGLLSMLSPTSLLSSPNPSGAEPSHPWSRRRGQTPSMSSTLSLPGTSSSGGVGLGFGAVNEEVDPETPLPVLEVPPSMLAVDLMLGPGETRTYTYTVQLPDAIPPTYKGRVFRFSYEFTVGVCRSRAASQQPSSPVGRPGTGAQSSSRVMKVPVRIYNFVSVQRPPCPYDLMWPVTTRNRHMSLAQAKVSEEDRRIEKGTSSGSSSKSRVAGSLEGVREYALRLLSSFPDPRSPELEVDGTLPVGALSPFAESPEREREPEGSLRGCREAVEILTRNQKKVSYDVNKDGVQVAVLTFTKSAYRLGETVLGVVELNSPSTRGRVLKLSAMLEAHESLPASIAMSGNSRQLRRVHAEHHSSFIPSMLRTTFALDIPPDASPAFQVDLEEGAAAGNRASAGGLEWKVRLCLLVAVASSPSKTGQEGKLKHLVRDGPRGEWATAWRASPSIAPMEKLGPSRNQNQTTVTPGGTMMSWASYFASFVGTAGETGYHDGDEVVDDEVAVEETQDTGAAVEDKWQELEVETVECEVPIKVWPGNTAFKAMEVVFDV